jgi:uracil-DNA glycosylase family 4
VPGFGDHNADMLIVGLAPAAHGANRTGRMFTGDRSGDFLYAGLYRAGLSNQPEASDRDDGLRLTNTYITAICRCAPPANKPTAAQRSNCSQYLAEELNLLKPAVAVCLGGIAFDGLLKVLAARGAAIPRPRPKFAHGAEYCVDGLHILACYHVSQQNTFTGRLTAAMLDTILRRAKSLARPGSRH